MILEDKEFGAKEGKIKTIDFRQLNSRGIIVILTLLNRGSQIN